MTRQTLCWARFPSPGMRIAALLAPLTAYMGAGAEGPGCSLKEQLSSTRCTEGKTFGCYKNGTVWVQGGCRGIFASSAAAPIQCWSVCRAGRTTCEPGQAFSPPKPPFHCTTPTPTPPPSPSPPTPFVPSNSPNMNGVYFRSETGTEAGARQTIREFHEYPGGVRYFDVYSPPFSTLYSQVFWTALPPVDIPQEVIDRYRDGGVMAMVGLECDQVQKNATGDGRDVSVPINAAYNHHFTATLAGAKVALERVDFDGPNDSRRQEFDSSHGLPDTVYRARELEPGVGGVSTHLGLGGGNGGEYRKTYHGFPAPYARLLESPRQFQFTPMQIDTWHRDRMPFNASGSSPFVAGPEPRNSLARHADALYSGLLECPLTTRITKQLVSEATLQMDSPCQFSTATAAECYSNAKAVIGAAAHNAKTATGDDTTKPVGCSVSMMGTDIEVFYNTAKQGGAPCGVTKGGSLGGAIDSVTQIEVHIDSAKGQVTITASGPSTEWFGVGFGASEMKGKPWTLIMEGNGNVTERQLADQSSGTLLKSSVTVVSNTVADGKRTAIMTRALKGVSTEYFSFTTQMATIPLINAVGSGPLLAVHKAKDPVTLSLLPTGSGGACVCAGKPAPFGAKKGHLLYTPTNQTGERGIVGATNFGNYCPPGGMRDDLLTHLNPTCDIRAYTGGQTACHHMWSLLDKDQDIPWHDQPLSYSIKFRFWYQDYNASFHRDLRYSGGTSNWDVGAGSGPARPGGAEYDVPRCNSTGQPGCKYEDFMGQPLAPGTAGGTWVHYVTGHFFIGENPKSGPWTPIVAHMHCHAPTCLSMAIYNNRTGEPICMERATYGGSNATAQGRDNAAALDRPSMNEPGFVAVPPCVWGENNEYNGELARPPALAGVPLKMVKRCNATYGHHGEMAHGQIFYDAQ